MKNKSRMLESSQIKLKSKEKKLQNSSYLFYQCVLKRKGIHRNIGQTTILNIRRGLQVVNRGGRWWATRLNIQMKKEKHR